MIGFWILVLVLGTIASVLIGGGIGYVFSHYGSQKGHLIGFIVGVVIFAGSIFAGNWWLNNTASGLRTRITWQAEINVGLNRNIQVFTATGELVYEYEGRFDVDQNENRIILDIINEDNEAHRVYISAPAGVVVIREIPE